MLDHDRIDTLDTIRDKPAVFAWLRSFLRWHVGAWSMSAGMRWSDADIDAHLDDFALVEREWDELARGADDPKQLVAVVRGGGRPLGLVHMQQREDRYLRMPIGVIAWIFVEPVSRGTGVSQMLMDAATAWMEERELRAAEVFVTADNAAAVNLYKRAGFRVIDHRMIGRVGVKSAR